MSLRVGSKGDLVRNIHIALQEHGFDPGHVDGVFGDKTSALSRRVIQDFYLLKNSSILTSSGASGKVS